MSALKTPLILAVLHRAFLRRRRRRGDNGVRVVRGRTRARGRVVVLVHRGVQRDVPQRAIRRHGRLMFIFVFIDVEQLVGFVEHRSWPTANGENELIGRRGQQRHDLIALHTCHIDAVHLKTRRR